MAPTSSDSVLFVGAFPRSLLYFRLPLLKALVGRGWRVSAAASGEDAAVIEGLARAGVSYTSVPIARSVFSPIEDLRAIWRLGTIILRQHPAVIVAYTIKPIIHGLLVGWFLRVPRRVAVIEGLGYAFTEGEGMRRRLIGQLARVIYRAVVRTATAVVVANKDDAALLQQLGYRAAGQQWHVTSTVPIDLDHFALTPMSAGPITFLMVSRILADKGVREYLAAAERVKSSRPDVRFQLIGELDPNPSAIAKEELEALLANGCVEYAPSADDIALAYRNCHVYVLPSYREGYPVTPMEAMATGRPVIVTDVPGCREVVRPGVDGWLVAARDVTALVEAMLLAAGSPDLERFGLAARNRAETDWSVDAINARLLPTITGPAGPPPPG